MRKSLVLAMLCLSALFAGCAEPGPLDPSAPLNVSVASRSIRLENESSRTIYYSIMTTELAARALWGPCTSPDEPCLRLEPRAIVLVPYSEIYGYEQGSDEALLRWWHLLERDGGWEVDEVRSVRVRLYASRTECIAFRTDERAMRTRPVVAAALALALGACSGRPTLPREEWVQARSTGEASLAVTNRGHAPVYVQVADPTELILLAGCSPSTCIRIAPGATVKVPFSQITAYHPGDPQAAVNWWVFQDDGSPVASGTVVVAL